MSVTSGLLLTWNPGVKDPNEQRRSKTTVMIITYALHLLLAILFMKAQQWIKKQAGQGQGQHQTQLLHEPWNPALTQNDYMRLCEEFLKNMETHFPGLEQGGNSGGGSAISSTWDIMFRSDNVVRFIDNFALERYKMYFRDAHGHDDSHVVSTRPTNHQVPFLLFLILVLLTCRHRRVTSPTLRFPPAPLNAPHPLISLKCYLGQSRA